MNPGAGQLPAAAGAGRSLPFAPARIALLLFDLDGTLVDSIGNLAWCGNRMLVRLGLPERDPRAARLWVGNGIERFVKRVLTGEMHAEPDSALFERGLEIFMRTYAEHVGEGCTLFPGVAEALDSLAGEGRHLACVTNKAEPFTSSLLAAVGLLPRFELVVAGNTTARQKPHPQPLRHAAAHFGLDADRCLMVGDSATDVAAARAAGFAVACVPYGYNHGIDIRESNPDLVVDDLRQLAALFARGG